MNNVIFLDIDGVLSSDEYLKRVELKVDPADYYNNVLYYGIDEGKIDLINKLNEEIELNIVITSTWRKMEIDKLNKIFKSKGANFDVVHRTTLREMDRGEQILEFLSGYEIYNYVVVDDNVHDILNHIPHDRILKVDRSVGLSKKDIEKIKNIFIRR